MFLWSYIFMLNSLYLHHWIEKAHAVIGIGNDNGPFLHFKNNNRLFCATCTKNTSTCNTLDEESSLLSDPHSCHKCLYKLNVDIWSERCNANNEPFPECFEFLLMKYYPQGLVTFSVSSTTTAAEQVLLNAVQIGTLWRYWRASPPDTQQYIQVVTV